MGSGTTRSVRMSQFATDASPTIGEVGKDASEIGDAGGLALMPGIIDLHTHYDAQVTWDPSLSPSPSLGVTTAIMGNCGFGRPCCMDQPVDAVIPCLPGLMRCGRSSGVPAPAYGSGRRQQLPLRPFDARWFASAAHDR